MSDIAKAINSIEFHPTLNEALWNGDTLRVDVRVSLLKSAMAFVEFLDLPTLKLHAIHLTGSNANYNYTPWSDCDLHLVVDFDSTGFPEIAENFFNTKKTLWNTLHGNVRVNGFPVELYVEDIKHPVTANGVYDILNGRWVKMPKAESPSWNSHDVFAKVLGLAEQINDAIEGKSPETIDAMFERLRTLRRAGLSKAGEFSTENLAFKTLRNLGYIERLAKARLKCRDAVLSLDSATCREAICEYVEGGLNRCTVQTVNAIADHFHFQPIVREADIPINSQELTEYLARYNIKLKDMPQAVGQTVKQFVNQHRVGTFYLSTEGHAMALIDGVLTDAAMKGPDNRKLVSAVECRR